MFGLPPALTPHCATFVVPVAKKFRASVLSDEEDEAEVSRSETNSIRATSSPRPFGAADDDEDDSQSQVKSKAKTKTGKDAASQSSDYTPGSSNSFLTAAERRAQSKKEEKKASETTYSFLQVRKDVSSLHICLIRLCAILN